MEWPGRVFSRAIFHAEAGDRRFIESEWKSVAENRGYGGGVEDRVSRRTVEQAQPDRGYGIE